MSVGRRGAATLGPMSDGWLPAEHGTDNVDLRQRVARGLLWTMADNWGRQLLGLIVFIVIARFVTDAELGLVALAAVFVNFAQIFVDQGMGDALVQRRTVTRSQIDTAFWISLAVGAVLTAAGILLAIPLATLLGEPDLAPILAALSFMFVLTALSTIQIALLRRELAFRSLALRSLLAIGGGGAVGIAMAVAGYGAWALVGQQLTTAVLAALTLWRVSHWRPSRRVSRADWRELFAFGRNVVGSDVLHFLSRNTDNLLIGVVLGPAALGIYAVGYRMLDAANSLLIGISRKVAFPAFSRLQHSQDRINRAFFRASRLSGVLIIPGYVGLALTASELIPLVFGSQWAAAGPVAAVLFLVGPVLGISSFSSALLNASGHPEVVFRLRLIGATTNVVGFFIAVWFGILAVAAAFVVRGYLLMPLNLYWQRKYARVPTGEYLRQLLGIGVATTAMAGAMIATRVVVADTLSSAALLLLEIVVGGGVFVVVLWFADRRLIGELVDLAAQVLPGGERARRGIVRRVGPAARVDRPAADTAGDADEVLMATIDDEL